jgi:hypothetical protein
VPDAAGGAEQRGADRRDDIAAVGQQEAWQQRVRAPAGPGLSGTTERKVPVE